MGRASDVAPGVSRKLHRLRKQVDQREVVSMSFLRVVSRHQRVGPDLTQQTNQITERLLTSPFSEGLLCRAPVASVRSVEVPGLYAGQGAARFGLEGADSFERISCLRSQRVLAASASGREQDRDTQPKL